MNFLPWATAPAIAYANHVLPVPLSAVIRFTLARGIMSSISHVMRSSSVHTDGSVVISTRSVFDAIGGPEGSMIPTGAVLIAPLPLQLDAAPGTHRYPPLGT